MKLLKILNDHFEEYLLVLLLTLDVIIVFAQVVTRYLLHSPLAWSEEIARYMFIWLVWIGAAYAVKENKHIKIDIIYNKLTGSTKRISDLVTVVLFLGLMGFMLYTSAKVTMTVYTSKSIATGSHMPMWIAWFSIPLSMALMIFRFLQRIYMYGLNDEKLKKAEEEKAAAAKAGEGKEAEA